MIDRYSRPEMVDIWAPENKFSIWLEIELLACEAQAELGVIPKDAPAKIRAKAGFDVARIDEIEQEVKHDVIAFLTSVAEHVGEESRFIHQGLTSSDILDTALAVQLTQAADLLIAALEKVLAALHKQAEAYKHTVCVGRSHGIHAEPTTFGLKMAGFYAEFSRNLARLKQARAEIAVGALSGAVGTYMTVDPYVEQYVCQKLGLQPETVATQVIPRDRHAAFFSCLGLIASSMERFAVEVRHLQRSEVREVFEAFGKGQKGSSAMPHKKNPILSENLTGLARMVRAFVAPAMENVALWHERDISHSSVERMAAPDATITLHFALHRLAGLVEGLVVDSARMEENLHSLGGLVCSQRVLLALTQKGISREEAYQLVQRNALPVWENGGDFLQNLKQDVDVAAHLSEKELIALFDLSDALKHVDTLFERTFGTLKQEAA